MSYAEEKFFTRGTHFGKQWRISILKDGGAGASERITASDYFFKRRYPFTSDRDFWNQKIIEPILEVKIIFNRDTDISFYRDIVANPDDTYRLQFQYDGAIDCFGSIRADMVQISEDPANPKVTLRAKPLAILRGTLYPLDAVDSFTEIAPLIGEMCNLTETNLDLYTYGEWTSPNGGTNDFFEDAAYNTYHLRDYAGTRDQDTQITYYEALEKAIPPGHILTLKDNAWHLVSVPYIAKNEGTSINRYKYTFGGTVYAKDSSATVDMRVSLGSDRGDSAIKTTKSDSKYFSGFKRIRDNFRHQTLITNFDLESPYVFTGVGQSPEAIDNTITADGSQHVIVKGTVEVDTNDTGGNAKTGVARLLLQAGDREYDIVGDQWELAGDEIEISLSGTGETLTADVNIETDAVIPSSVGEATLRLELRYADDQGSAFSWTADEVTWTITDYQLVNEDIAATGASKEFIREQTQQYEEVLSIPDRIFGEGPTPYSKSAISYLSTNYIPISTFDRKSGASVDSYADLVSVDIMNAQRDGVRVLKAALWSDFGVLDVVPYDGGYFMILGGDFEGYASFLDATMYQLTYSTGSDTLIEVQDAGGSPTGGRLSGSNETDGITESQADARYFKQASLLSEVSAGDLPTLYGNIGLDDGSADLDLNSLDINGSPFVDSSRNVMANTGSFVGNVSVTKENPRLTLDRGEGTGQLALTRYYDSGSQVGAWGYDYTNNALVGKDEVANTIFYLDRNEAKASGDILNIHGNAWLTIRNGGNIGSGRQYLFMDIDTWSTNNGGASVDDANNFHFYDTGNSRIEFETDGEMAFYIEGGPGQNAWYGLQEGGTHHWSFGSDASQNGDLRFTAGFNLGATHILTLGKDGDIGQGIQDPEAFFHSRRQDVAAGVHQSVSAHQDWLLEAGGDGVLQIASDNGGSVGTAIVLTGMETSTDGRHWVIEHAGTTEDNNFGIGYYQSSATEENIVGGFSPFLTISTDGDVALYDGGIGTDNFSDWFSVNPSGWEVAYNGTADFRTVLTDELIAKAFTADVAQALAGSDFLTKSVTKLASDFVVPAVGSTVTINVEDLEGLPDLQTFEAGDWLRFRVVDRTGGGLAIYDVYGTVSAYVDNADDTQDWTLTVDYAGPSDAAVGRTIYKGAIVLDYGVSGDTFIERTVLDRSSGTDFSKVPYDRIVRWTNSGSGGPRPSATGYSAEVLTQTGNINGLGGFTTETYGFYAKDNVIIDLDGGNMSIGKNVGGAGIDGIHIDAGDYWYTDGTGSVGNGILNWDASVPEVNLASFTVDDDKLVGNNVNIGRNLTAAASNIYIGDFAIDRSQIRVVGDTTDTYVLMREVAGNSAPLFEISVGGNSIVDVRIDEATFFGFTVDDAKLYTGDGTNGYVGLGATAAATDRAFWAGAANADGSGSAAFYVTQEGRIFHASIGTVIFGGGTEAIFGANNSASSVIDNYWNTSVQTSGGSSNTNSQVKIRPRYYKRFGEANLIMNGFIQVEGTTTNVPATHIGRVYLIVKDAEGGSTVASDSTSLNALSGNIEEQEFTITLDVSGLSDNTYYLVEVETEAEVDGDGSQPGTDTQTTGIGLREDVLIRSAT